MGVEPPAIHTDERACRWASRPIIRVAAASARASASGNTLRLLSAGSIPSFLHRRCGTQDEPLNRFREAFVAAGIGGHIRLSLDRIGRVAHGNAEDRPF